tara:strand:+ start:119 stop:961 length:843 start_codon:yes stop_codon:yes gene_type:complete
MKKLLLALLVGTLLAGCGGDKGSEVDGDGDSQGSQFPNLDDPAVREEIIAKAVLEEDMEDDYTGWLKQYHRGSGELEGLILFKNGEPKALTIWYDNGRKRKEVRPGSGTAWYPDGAMSRKTTFNSEQEEHGPYKSWYPDGTLKQEGDYKDGQKNGLWISYNEDGTVKDRVSYSDGGEVSGQPRERSSESPGDSLSRAKVRIAEVWVNSIGKQFVTLHYLRSGRYPKKLEELVEAGIVRSRKELEDPWGKQYQFKVPGTKNPRSFDLWTTSPDEIRIGNWD